MMIAEGASGNQTTSTIWDCGATDTLTNRLDIMWELSPVKIRISGVGPSAIVATAVGQSRFGTTYYCKDVNLTLVSQGSLRDQGIPYEYDNEADAYHMYEGEGIDQKIYTFQRRSNKGLYELDKDIDLRPTTANNSEPQIHCASIMQDEQDDNHQQDSDDEESVELAPYDSDEEDKSDDNVDTTGYDDVDIFIYNTIKQANANKRKKSAKTVDQECTEIAMQIHHNLGHPNVADTIDMIGREITGCFHDKSAIAAAYRQLKSCTFCDLGKSVRNDPFIKHKKSTVPGEVLCADVVYTTHRKTNTVMQHLSMDEASDHLSIANMEANNRATLSDIHRQLHIAWKARGFETKTIKYDADKVVSSMTQDTIKIAQAQPGEHQPTIERTVRTMRERIRTITSTLNFHPDERMVGYLMKYIVDTLNCVKSKTTGKIPNKVINPEWSLDLNVDLTLAYGDLILCNIKRGKSSVAKLDPAKHACIVMHTSMDGTGQIRIYSLNTQQYYVSTGKLGTFKKLVWTDNIRNVVNLIIHDDVEQPIRDVEDYFVPLEKEQFLAGDFDQSLPAVLLRKRAIELMDAYKKAKLSRDAHEFEHAEEMQQNEQLADLAQQVTAHREKKEKNLREQTDDNSMNEESAMPTSSPLAEGHNDNMPPVEENSDYAVQSKDMSATPITSPMAEGYVDNVIVNETRKSKTTNKPKNKASNVKPKSSKAQGKQVNFKSQPSNDKVRAKEVIPRPAKRAKSVPEPIPPVTENADEGSSKRIKIPKVITSVKATLSDPYEPTPDLIRAFNYLLQTSDEGSNEALIRESKKKEMLNIVSHDTISPVHFSSLTVMERVRRVLGRNDTKQKRSGIWKSRFAAGVGSKPQNPDGIMHSASPVAKTQSMLIGLRVARKENRHITTADIAGAFLHATLKPAFTKDKEPFRRIIQIDAETAKILVEIKPEWEIYVNQGVGPKKTFKGFMFFEINRALYGLIEASLAWYENILETLLNMGFVQSLSDPCVLHNYSNGNRSSIILYVDDLLILAKNQHETETIIRQLRDRYTELKHVTPDENNEIDYLNIQIQQTENGIRLHQTKYIKNMFETLHYHPEKTCDRELPYQANLFEVDHESPPLDAIQQKEYRKIIGKLLYTSTKTRVVLALPISFLASRTVHATAQDMRKLYDLLDWLHANQTGGLLIEHHADDDMQVYTWADASDNCHSDARGHTGIYMSIGKVHGSPVFYMSKKQTLVTKSSTESELIAVYVAIPHAQWAREALNEWGYEQDHAVIFQDNISTIVISHRGNKPFSKSGHINRRYMIAQQHIEDGTLKMPHCSTDKMLSDPLTKTLNIRTSDAHYRKMAGADAINQQTITLTKDEMKVFLTLFNTTEFLNEY